jgi:hypothetical protein
MDFCSALGDRGGRPYHIDEHIGIQESITLLELHIIGPANTHCCMFSPFRLSVLSAARGKKGDLTDRRRFIFVP